MGVLGVAKKIFGVFEEIEEWEFKKRIKLFKAYPWPAPQIEDVRKFVSAVFFFSTLSPTEKMLPGKILKAFFKRFNEEIKGDLILAYKDDPKKARKVYAGICKILFPEGWRTYFEGWKEEAEEEVARGDIIRAIRNYPDKDAGEMKKAFADLKRPLKEGGRGYADPKILKKYLMKGIVKAVENEIIKNKMKKSQVEPLIMQDEMAQEKGETYWDKDFDEEVISTPIRNAIRNTLKEVVKRATAEGLPKAKKSHEELFVGPVHKAVMDAVKREEMWLKAA